VRGSDAWSVERGGVERLPGQLKRLEIGWDANAGEQRGGSGRGWGVKRWSEIYAGGGVCQRALEECLACHRRYRQKEVSNVAQHITQQEDGERNGPSAARVSEQPTAIVWLALSSSWSEGLTSMMSSATRRPVSEIASAM